MNAHWPKHKEYHKEQKKYAIETCEGSLPDDRSLAEAHARHAEVTGSEYDKRFAEALALAAEGDNHAAAKAWRKIIKEWPSRPTPYNNLAVVLDISCRNVEAAQMYLNAMELHDEGTKQWAESAAAAFDTLKLDECREAPKPEWWNDEELKALSAWVVAAAPDNSQACTMRARVLESDALCKAPWNAGPRTATEIKEAATWYRHAAARTLVPATKLSHESLAANMCDMFADRLLTKEEAEAAKARAAAAAEEAEALKMAEAKAAASAEELLAEEEEEEKQQASTKVDQLKCKGKKGKGKKGKGKSKGKR